MLTKVETLSILSNLECSCCNTAMPEKERQQRLSSMCMPSDLKGTIAFCYSCSKAGVELISKVIGLLRALMDTKFNTKFRKKRLTFSCRLLS